VSALEGLGFGARALLCVCPGALELGLPDGLETCGLLALTLLGGSLVLLGLANSTRFRVTSGLRFSLSSLSVFARPPLQQRCLRRHSLPLQIHQFGV
jgi:hypothetical protein